MSNKPDSGPGIAVSNALQMYFETREEEVSSQTLQAHRYRLSHFERWCDSNIEDTMDLDGSKLHEYRLWRREDGDLNNVSLHTQLSTLRVFLKFCEQIEVVREDLAEKLIVPSLNDDEDRRETVLDSDRADEILDWLSTYEYASFDHVLLLILWRTGLRIGAVRALDVDDYEGDDAHLYIQHRPDRGTPLKLGTNGERVIALRESTLTVIDDYINSIRPDTVDENGREPLLTLGNGRPSTSTFRRHVYRCTQPCQRSGKCPHDTSMDECDVVGYSETASCPSVRSPHDVRRGAITHFLENDIPKPAVSDRMNVKEDTMDRHYDTRDEVTKAEQRRKYINRL